MTTTTISVRRGPQPDPADIAAARDDLTQRITGTDAHYGHSFVLGVVQARPEMITETHAGCRKASCDMCLHLRRIGAVLTAFEEVRTP